jgi:hypothetical protein
MAATFARVSGAAGSSRLRRTAMVPMIRGGPARTGLGHALSAEGVRFVLVGGLAAQAHGSPSITNDLDICYVRDGENLQALARVLARIAAIRRGLPDDAPRMPPLDARTLRAGGLSTLATRFGDFGLLATPDPDLDYETLLRGSVRATAFGISVQVAGLDDLIAMKRAAGRPKDRIELEILGALREEIDRRS